LFAFPSPSNSGFHQGGLVEGSATAAIGVVRLLDRRVRQKMNIPSRIARDTMGIVTPMAIFAPVEGLCSGGSVGNIVVELVLDVVARLLGVDAGATVLLAVVENDKVGVKSFKIAVSVLCHRT
jgi:hypothetical protein